MTKYKSKFTGQQIDDGIEYGVRVTQQTFSSAQKQQARENIGVTPEVQVGGNTPASDSGVKLFVDENSDDTIEVHTKAQATGQFIVVVNSVSVPTASTLTYTATDGTTKSFKVGDEIRVPDAEADNGYTFYKLYALTTESGVTTATWDKVGAGGGGSAAGLEIVAASGTTLNAEVGKYYRYDSDVTILAVTLPTITGATEVQEFKMCFKTASSNPSITFTGGTIKKIGDFIIIANCTYEVDCKWNGVEWILEANHGLPYDAEIEYLEGVQGAYIKTGVFINNYNWRTFVLEFDGSWINSNNNKWLCQGIGYAYPCFYIAINQQNNLSYGTGNSDGVTARVLSLNEYTSRHKYKADYINSLVYFDDEAYQMSLSSSTSLSNTEFYLFTWNSNNYSLQNYMVGGKMYGFKIIANDALVRDFIPVRVGQVGYLYDKVSCRLFGNSGTGSFVLGSDV